MAEVLPPTSGSEGHYRLKGNRGKLRKKGVGIWHPDWRRLKSCSDSSSRLASAEKSAGKDGSIWKHTRKHKRKGWESKSSAECFLSSVCMLLSKDRLKEHVLSCWVIEKFWLAPVYHCHMLSILCRDNNGRTHHPQFAFSFWNGNWLLTACWLLTSCLLLFQNCLQQLNKNSSNMFWFTLKL